ncbi:hypothetical protein Tco_0050274, partial [Tanacetum coccineum]
WLKFILLLLKKGKQHIIAESSNKNDEVCNDVTANRTSCDGSLSHKPDDSFRYEAGGVEHVMTSEEIAKENKDEEIIKRKNEENKASHVVVADIHITSQKKGKQHTVAESSNKNDKVCDAVTAN